jgi:hypothetical protein
MGDPRPGLDRGGNRPNRAIGNADQNEVGLVGQLKPALAQPGSHRGSDAAGADDLRCLDQTSSSSVADTGRCGV